LETLKSGESESKLNKKRNLSFRFKLIIALSSIVSLRTYKILYSNIFLDRYYKKEGLKSNKF
jgi:hypothetical protein